MQIEVLSWMWGSRFQAVHANVVRRALALHLNVPHRLNIIADRFDGFDRDIRVLPMPMQYDTSIRCRRRMQGFSRDLSEAIAGPGGTILYLDLDVVIRDDITPLVVRPEPITGWKVGHAGVYSGSFLVAKAGALDGAWQKFHRNPEGWPNSLSRNASDQAMLNDWLKTQPPIGTLTESDGLVTYYGKGYERLEHLGVGPNRPNLPPGARIVVLGSSDLEVLESDRFDWVRDHWQSLRSTVPA